MIKYSKLFILENLKKIDFNIWKINILQFEKLLNILGVQMISNKWKIKFENKIIE